MTRREGVKMARGSCSAREPVRGAYIMPSFGRYGLAAEALEVLRLPATAGAE